MAGFFIAFVLVFNFTEFTYEIKLGITIVAGSAGMADREIEVWNRKKKSVITNLVSFLFFLSGLGLDECVRISGRPRFQRGRTYPSRRIPLFRHGVFRARHEPPRLHL